MSQHYTILCTKQYWISTDLQTSTMSALEMVTATFLGMISTLVIFHYFFV